MRGVSYFFVPKGTELPEQSAGMFAYRLRYLRREEQKVAIMPKEERMATTHPEQHILEVHFAHLWVRTSKSHSRRTSPSQVFGSCDSLLCRTPFQKTIINYFLFTNRFRCTKKKKHHLAWCFLFYIVPKGNELPKQSVGMFAYRLRYLRREEQKVAIMPREERMATTHPEQHIPE